MTDTTCSGQPPCLHGLTFCGLTVCGTGRATRSGRDEEGVEGPLVTDAFLSPQRMSVRSICLSVGVRHTRLSPHN